MTVSRAVRLALEAGLARCPGGDLYYGRRDQVDALADELERRGVLAAEHVGEAPASDAATLQRDHDEETGA